jgi:hypothetical protein
MTFRKTVAIISRKWHVGYRKFMYESKAMHCFFLEERIMRNLKYIITMMMVLKHMQLTEKCVFELLWHHERSCKGNGIV